MDEAVRSFGKAAAVKITVANSYIRAFHVESRWHRYNVYATLPVTAPLSECMSAGMFHCITSWTVGFGILNAVLVVEMKMNLHTDYATGRNALA